VVPEMMPRLLQDPDRARASRAMKAMLKMKKIVIADIEAAANG
jgi:predicted 3-demethylubiquinone-9 3-methyltransferase (glyoxalase superfamily)